MKQWTCEKCGARFLGDVCPACTLKAEAALTTPPPPRPGSPEADATPGGIPAFSETADGLMAAITAATWLKPEHLVPVKVCALRALTAAHARLTERCAQQAERLATLEEVCAGHASQIERLLPILHERDALKAKVAEAEAKVHEYRIEWEAACERDRIGNDLRREAERDALKAKVAEAEAEAKAGWVDAQKAYIDNLTAERDALKAKVAEAEREAEQILAAANGSPLSISAGSLALIVDALRVERDRLAKARDRIVAALPGVRWAVEPGDPPGLQFCRPATGSSTGEYWGTILMPRPLAEALAALAPPPAAPKGEGA